MHLHILFLSSLALELLNDKFSEHGINRKCHKLWWFILVPIKFVGCFHCFQYCGSRIRDPVPFSPLDPGFGIGFLPDPGSLTHIFEGILKFFLGENFNNSLKIGFWTGNRDPGRGKNQDPGTGINIPDPPHWLFLLGCNTSLNVNVTDFKIWKPVFRIRIPIGLWIRIPISIQLKRWCRIRIQWIRIRTSVKNNQQNLSGILPKLGWYSRAPSRDSCNSSAGRTSGTKP